MFNGFDNKLFTISETIARSMLPPRRSVQLVRLVLISDVVRHVPAFVQLVILLQVDPLHVFFVVGAHFPQTWAHQRVRFVRLV